MKKTILIAPIFLMGYLSNAYSDFPLKLFTSPSNQYHASILLTPLPGASPGSEPFILHVDKLGAKVIEVPTMGFLLGVLWNSDEHFVAINNRRANSGDYAWIIDLNTGKVLRAPDDSNTKKLISEKVTVKYPELTYANMNRRFTVVKQWLSVNEVAIETTLSFRKTSIPGVILKEVFSVSDGGLILEKSDLDLR